MRGEVIWRTRDGRTKITTLKLRKGIFWYCLSRNGKSILYREAKRQEEYQMEWMKKKKEKKEKKKRKENKKRLLKEVQKKKKKKVMKEPQED
ncbi:hypothetical protein Tco_0104602 [Tanacetum coccineum]